MLLHLSVSEYWGVIKKLVHTERSNMLNIIANKKPGLVNLLKYFAAESA